LYLSQHRDRLSQDLKGFRLNPCKPMVLTDPFLATAALQKSLRRADGVYAHGAANALLEIDPMRLWRRLVVVVCEDFGLSDLALTAEIIAAASDKAWRKRVRIYYSWDEVRQRFVIGKMPTHLRNNLTN
jgi:hypothetical protein